MAQGRTDPFSFEGMSIVQFTTCILCITNANSSLFSHQGDESTPSKVLHKVSVAKNTKIPICALLAILEIQEDRLLVPAVNHHRVNANSKNYKELERYLCNCISENSDETLDLIMEGVMFKQEKTKFPTSVPFAFAEDTTL